MLNRGFDASLAWQGAPEQVCAGAARIDALVEELVVKTRSWYKRAILPSGIDTSGRFQAEALVQIGDFK